MPRKGLGAEGWVIIFLESRYILESVLPSWDQHNPILFNGEETNSPRNATSGLRLGERCFLSLLSCLFLSPCYEHPPLFPEPSMSLLRPLLPLWITMASLKDSRFPSLPFPPHLERLASGGI